jgi:hypothetical protein
VASGVPGTSPATWSAPGAAIAAPDVPGLYALWVQVVETPDDATAIQAFKTAVVTGADPTNKFCPDVLTVQP